MNFEQALDILNRWPPDEEAPLSPEQEQALQWLDHDPDLERALRQQDAFDERISWVMSDVPVDSSLKSRMLEQLAPPAIAQPPADPASTRRFASRRAATVAVLAGALGGVALWLLPRNEPLTFADIRGEIPAVWRSAGLPEMSPADAPGLPDGGWLSTNVAFDAAIGRYSLGADERRAIAVRRFSIRDRQSETVSGMLLALPADVIAPHDRPKNSDFFGGLKDSIVLDEGTLALVSWAQRDTVYVCLIPSGPAEAALQDALRIELS